MGVEHIFAADSFFFFFSSIFSRFLLFSDALQMKTGSLNLDFKQPTIVKISPRSVEIISCLFLLGLRGNVC